MQSSCSAKGAVTMLIDFVTLIIIDFFMILFLPQNADKDIMSNFFLNAKYKNPGD